MNMRNIRQQLTETIVRGLNVRRKGTYIRESIMLKSVSGSFLVLAGLGFGLQYAAAAVIDTGTGASFVYQRDVSPSQDADSIMTEAVSTPWLAWHHGEGSPAIAYLGAPYAPLGDPSGIILQFHAPDGYQINSANVFLTGRVTDGGAPTTDYVQGLWGTTARPNWWDYFGNDTPFFTDSTPGYFSQTVNLAAAGFAGGVQDLYLSFQELQQTAGSPQALFLTTSSAIYTPGLIVTLDVAPQVPEPATLGLLLIGGGILSLLRRRK